MPERKLCRPPRSRWMGHDGAGKARVGSSGVGSTLIDRNVQRLGDGLPEGAEDTQADQGVRVLAGGVGVLGHVHDRPGRSSS